MELSPALITAINRGIVAIEGRGHQLRFVSVVADREPPHEATVATITAEITRGGECVRVVCTFQLKELSDVAFVVGNLVAALRRVIADDVPPTMCESV